MCYITTLVIYFLEEATSAVQHRSLCSCEFTVAPTGGRVSLTNGVCIPVAKTSTGTSVSWGTNKEGVLILTGVNVHISVPDQCLDTLPAGCSGFVTIDSN